VSLLTEHRSVRSLLEQAGRESAAAEAARRFHLLPPEFSIGDEVVEEGFERAPGKFYLQSWTERRLRNREAWIMAPTYADWHTLGQACAEFRPENLALDLWWRLLICSDCSETTFPSVGAADCTRLVSRFTIIAGPVFGENIPF
jgi:hypothetical protein